jgi:hypothetical protein
MRPLTYEIHEICEFDEIHRAPKLYDSTGGPLLSTSYKIPGIGKKDAYHLDAGEENGLLTLQMSFKIEPVVDCEGGSTFRVSGDLREDNVRILEELLAKVTKHVVLDLKEVILADRHAVALLALCERNGGQLMNCPVYLREWVTNERAHIRSGRK